MDADRTPSKGDPGWFQQFRNTDGSILDDKIECDSKVCSNEGLYYSTKTCCGDVLIHCRECFAGLFHFLDKKEKEGYTSSCPNCGTKQYPTQMYNKVQNIRLTPA